MNRKIERINLIKEMKYKLFNILPLRTSACAKYITIDTSILNNLFIGNEKYFKKYH